jgi:hypothetical protein
MTTRRAVSLDRDGTLNKHTGYPADLRLVRIYPEAFEAVRRLGRAGYGHSASAALAARGIRPAHTAAGVLAAAAWILERGRGPGHGPV